MKTRYRHIHFEEDTRMEVEGKITWFCRNNRDRSILGRITWYAPWRRWVFEAKPGCVFDYNCLRDVAGFLQNELQ